MSLDQVHSVYFIGVGGIGMSALARYFNANNVAVAGYDRVETELTKKLEHAGVSVHYIDDVSEIKAPFLDKDHCLVVYTPAVPQDHKELLYFKKEGFTILKRAELLGLITKESICLAVAGTHGKTTTSTMLGHVMEVCNTNATSFLGGISENYHSNLILGGTEVSVVEADEFDRSFLHLSPNIACITSMDADHLDIYGSGEALVATFKEFAGMVSQVLIVKKGLPIDGLTYGIDEEADYSARNIKVIDGKYRFDIVMRDATVRDVHIHLPGRHNVLNSLAAFAMAHQYGLAPEAIAKAFLSFEGIERRFSYKIKEDNFVLIDDYAHHPTEINAVAEAVREMYPEKKIVAVFQPHLFSRTKDFSNDFAQALARFDSLILLDIYPARELPMEGVTSEWLLSKVCMESKQLVSKGDLLSAIRKEAAEVLVMMGAGDISVEIKKVVKAMHV
ncbi:MAG: UDP-N-acetylmuramate--L-alanine ligase [Flavobacteriaceae bacterium]|nr:MAG: UDP-N-acetylmuramate--L-alanine ligase [Flavobacteriaceae bacterium]